MGAMSKFDKLKAKFAARGDVADPAGLAADVGRKKHGKTAFQKMAAAGRKKKTAS